MTALDKTRNLLRLDLPITLLEKNSENPNKMSQREFDLLIDNMEKTGITDPILVRPLDYELVKGCKKAGGKYLVKDLEACGAQFRIVGGHHRFDGALYLGFETVPVTIIMDESFDEEQERFQLVRMNAIRGRLDPQAFFDLYNKLSEQYTDEILQDAFGFAEEAEFKRLIAQTAKTLPNEKMQEKFKEAAQEIKTIDQLSALLNKMFTMYGDTLPYGYMVVDYGGQRSVWLQVNKKTMDALDLVGDLCIEKKRTMDDIVGRMVQLIAKGDVPEVVEKLIKETPEVELPDGVEVAPTKDHLAKIGSI